MTPLDQALLYLEQGYSIFPLLPLSKRPHTDLLVQTSRQGSWKSFQLAPPTRDEVIWWFTTDPQANIAIVTGQVSNLTVIDVDTKNSSIEEARRITRDLDTPRTRIIETPSKGYHLYYRFDSPDLPSLFTKNHTALLPNIDVRSQGGYVVAPPSITDVGSYTLVSDLPPAEFPSNHPMFADLISSDSIVNNDSPLAKRSPQEWESFITSSHPSGQRNSDLTSLIGKLLRHLHYFLSPHTIYTLISSYNQTHIHPPLTQDELDRTFMSILKRYER